MDNGIFKKIQSVDSLEYEKLREDCRYDYEYTWKARAWTGWEVEDSIATMGFLTFLQS